jgi:hypothetical protein
MDLLELQTKDLFQSPKIYYKVTTKDLISRSISLWTYGITYKIGEWVKPRIGKLFVFDTLQSAQAFEGKDIYGDGRIFECEIVESPFKLSICSKFLSIDEFWRRHTEVRETGSYDLMFTDNELELMNCPLGTVMADEVKLIKEV